MVLSRDNLFWDLSTLSNLRRYAHLSNPHLSRDQFKSLWSMAVSATICLGESAEKFGQILSHSDNPFGLSFERLIEKRRRRASRRPPRPGYNRLCSKSSRHVIEPLGVGSGRQHAAWLALLPRDTHSGGAILIENQQSKDHVEIILKTFNDILSMLGKVRRAKLGHRKWRKIVAVKMAAGRFSLGRKITQIVVTSVDEFERQKILEENIQNKSHLPSDEGVDPIKLEPVEDEKCLETNLPNSQQSAEKMSPDLKEAIKIMSDSADVEFKMAPIEIGLKLSEQNKIFSKVPENGVSSEGKMEESKKNDDEPVQNDVESDIIKKMTALNVTEEMSKEEEWKKCGAEPNGDLPMMKMVDEDPIRGSTPTIKVTKSCRPGPQLVSTLKTEMIKKKMIHPNTLQKRVCDLTNPKNAQHELTRSLSSTSLLGADLNKKKLNQKLKVVKQLTEDGDDDDEEGEIPSDEMMDSNFFGHIKSTPMALVVPTILSNSILLRKMTAAVANKEIMADALAWDFFRSRRS